MSFTFPLRMEQNENWNGEQNNIFHFQFCGTAREKFTFKPKEINDKTKTEFLHSTHFVYDSQMF